MTGELDGRVIVISGAARGQGRAIAERVIGAGGRVIAGDVLEDVHELRATSGDVVHTDHLDVTVESSWEQLVAGGLARFGKVDGLVNNAGVLHRRRIERETAEELERLWRVNCLGPFLGMQAVLPHLRDAGGGAVVNTLSTAATTVWAAHGAYASSKWALRGLTKVAALELADDGIRVNAIVPGPVLTPMVVRPDDPNVATRLADTPLGRAGAPGDIAELVVFLLSDRASFITGAEVAIDGGQTAGFSTRPRS